MLTSDRNLLEAIEQCENEPIRIPGSVQPHGILMTLRMSDLTILQISESVFDLAGIHHSELLHQPLSKLMPIEPVERATQRLGDRTPRLLNPIPIRLSAHGKTHEFDGILHRSGRVLILELERHVSVDRGYGGFGGFYEAIREVTSKMMVTENLGDVLQLACDELRKLTGFSRVLAYKFDPDWHGQVVNESKNDEVESLLHHRFPASDIPKQARDLYTSNWLRLIPNADYKPANICPAINPITDTPLDLSNSVLRSVSPVHLEYMRNMGQMASMSVSLLKGKKLWGLISCHHPEAHFLKYDVRVASEFIGQMVSAQIIAREDAAEVDAKLQLKKLYDDLLRYGGGYASIPHSFALNATSLLGLVDAYGAAMFFDGAVSCVGAVPATEELKEIYDWILSKNESLLVTNALTKLPGKKTAVSDEATGLLAITVPGRAGDAILWFRPEIRNRVKWAGDPTGGKSLDADGRIRPRKSFETWYENTAGQARKWTQREIDAADELRTAVIAMSAGHHGISASGHGVNTVFRNSLTSSIAATNALSILADATPFKKNRSTQAAFDSSLLLEGFAEFAVLFLDRNGAIQNWSVGAKRTLGYDGTEVLGKSIQMFFAEEDMLSQKHENILEIARKHTRCEEELWLYRLDQTSFWGKILVSQVRDRSNNLIGFSVVIQDVTREKSSEEELKAMKLSAEAANRSKSAFLANISHEIRTPLGAVLGFAELMSARGLPDEDKLELFSKVKRNGDQLTVLINDLLDISKIESGKIEVERIPTDLQTLLYDCEQLFTSKAGEKSVELKFRVTKKIPLSITTDPTRLRQVIINLLSNAIKFTPSGGTVILECSGEHSDGDNRIIFRVIDTGRGMTEAEMEKLFQPFAQADVSTTRQYGGTGLGLFLSQRLARALGGDLSIEWSRPGQGSCFTASIDPGSVDFEKAFTQILPPDRKAQSGNLNSRILDNVKILVVDDSLDNRELIKTYLSKAGAEILLAENGLKGVEKALSEKFDLVLMDVQMPVLDGNQAMKILNENRYEQPVIALTAHAMKEERDFSLQLGFSDYLTKPIDRTLLISSIRQILDQRADA